MNLPHHRDADSRFDIPPPEIRSDLIQEFHQHWLQLWRDGRLPSRADIDPADFKRILPNIILAEIETDPPIPTCALRSKTISTCSTWT
jgi:hypothetical protein